MAFGGSGFGGNSNLFSNTQSAFGTPAPVFGQSSSFGASSSGFGAGSSGFGALGQPQSQSLWGTGAVPTFGQQNAFQQQPVGNPQSTRAVKWQVSQLQDSNSNDPSRFHSISAMNQFQQFSVEELRAGDYGRGDKGNAQSGFGGSGIGGGGFGASGFGQSSGGFGATNTFGASSQPLFGNTSSAFGGGNNLFGQTQQQQQQQTGFGSFGQTMTGFGQQQSGFGQSSSAFGGSSSGVFGAAVFGSNTGFGQTAAQSGGFGSGFGNSGASGFGAASGSGFGSQGASSSGFGASGFGASSQSLFGGGTQQGGGLFGSQQSGASLFGQQQSGASGFGAPTQSAPSLFGGQSSGGSLFGVQQQPQGGGGLFGGGQSSGGGLFGVGQQSSGGLFGSQQGGGQFGASSSALGGSNLFGGASGSQQAGSLFGGSTMGSSSGGGLFGSGSSGTSLFGNTGSSLFGSGSGFGVSSSNLFGSQPSGSLFGNTSSGFGMSGSMFGSGIGFGIGSQPQQQQQQQQNGPLEASLTSNPFGNSNLFANIPKGSTAPQLPSGASQSQGTQGKAVSVVVGPIGGRSRRVRGGDELQSRQSRAISDSWYRPRARPWSRNGSLFDLDDMMREKDHSRDYITPWRTEEQRVRARNLKKLVIEPIEEDPILKRDAHGAGANIRRKVRSEDETPVTPQETEPGLRTPRLPFAKNGVNTSEKNEVKEDGEETVIGVDESETVEPLGKEVEHDRTEPAVKKEEEILESARYVPYSEFYRNQYATSGRKEPAYGKGKEQKVENNVGHKVIIAPTCRRAEYKTVPSIEELQNMSEEELIHVENFAIYRESIGAVQWEEPVDVRGLNLDEIVSIEPGTVTIYPSNDSVPQPGEGLNKPAIVRMHGVWKKKGGVVQKDAHSVAKMVKNLKHHCDREGLQFLGYDVGTGTWSFRAQRF